MCRKVARPEKKPVMKLSHPSSIYIIVRSFLFPASAFPSQYEHAVVAMMLPFARAELLVSTN